MEACHSTSCDNIGCRRAMSCRTDCAEGFSGYQQDNIQTDTKIYNPYWGYYLCGTSGGGYSLTTDFDGCDPFELYHLKNGFVAIKSVHGYYLSE